jgi:hypothetical protein
MDVSDRFLALVSRVLIALIAVVLLLGCVLAAHGQNAGVVGVQAQMIQVFTAQSTNKSSGGIWQCGISTSTCPVFQDIGQGLSVLFFCGASTATYTIDFDFQPVGQTAFKTITQASYVSDSSCHTLQLGGYFPNLRSTLSISAGNVSAWYSGSSAPISFAAPAVGSNGATSPISCDQPIVMQVGTGVTSSLLSSTFTAGTITAICSMTVSFSTATTGGNIQLFWAGNNTCSVGTFGWEEFTPASAPQYLTVPLTMRGPTPVLQQPCIQNSSGSIAIVSAMVATVAL